MLIQCFYFILNVDLRMMLTYSWHQLPCTLDYIIIIIIIVIVIVIVINLFLLMT